MLLRTTSRDDMINTYQILMNEFNNWKLKENKLEKTSYNLLMTREWMMVVPRSRAKWQDLEVNALGFTGYLLVRTDDALEWLKKNGPLKLLENVAFPSSRYLL